MRKITILFILSFFFLLSCGSDSDDDNTRSEFYNQDISSSSDRVIYNPDMGFYSAETISVQVDGSVNKTSVEKASFLDEKASYNSDATFNLIHLKIDISQCRNLSRLDLSGIDTLLSNLEKAEQTAVIRFAYDKNYKGNKSGVEPDDFSTILNHIEDICALLKKHTKVLTALECGMLGPWGEMHTTSFAEDPMPVDKFKSTLKSISPNLNPSIKASEKKIEKGLTERSFLSLFASQISSITI